MTHLPRQLSLCALLLLAGCNAVRWQHGQLESQLKSAGLTEHTDQLGDATVHYWEGGHPSKGARALLLVHGFGGDAISLWAPQAAALAASRRVVVPDLLWFGGSSSSVADYSLRHQVTTLIALLDRLSERSVDVAGVSYGGLVSFELASLFPERVDRLVLVDSPGCAYTRADHEAMLKRFGVERPVDFLVPRDEAGVTRLFSIAYEDPPWAPDFAKRQVVQELYSRFNDEKAALLDSAVASMATHPGCEAAPDKPTLVVFGRGDQIFPVAVGERLVKQLGARATFKVIEKARHAPNLEHPAEVNKLLEEFLPPRPP
jgi:pimeloyl-ACP methyl ester carboxylesterase